MGAVTRFVLQTSCEHGVFTRHYTERDPAGDTWCERPSDRELVATRVWFCEIRGKTWDSPPCLMADETHVKCGWRYLIPVSEFCKHEFHRSWNRAGPCPECGLVL